MESGLPNATVRVKTTLPVRPLPPNTARKAVETENLLIRPPTPEDVTAWHSLRTQPDVMQWTRIGRIDASIAETQAKLDLFLPPNDVRTYQCSIILRATGQVIGMGGVHMLVDGFGWPEIGYMFRQETWGKGYATEFVRAFVRMWAELPREEVEIVVDGRTTRGDGTAEECLIAITVDTNKASHGVLKKGGFQDFLTFEAPNETENEFVGQIVKLPVFRFFPGQFAKAEEI